MTVDTQSDTGVLQNPVAPIALIAPPSGKELMRMIDGHLAQRRGLLSKESPHYGIYPGFSRKSFEIESTCPRFANGEGKAVLNASIRGYDVFVIADVGNYGCKFKIYGNECCMSPDDHFQDIKRMCSVVNDKARRLTVITPYLYEGRQHQRKLRESLDCALALHELENLGVNNLVTFDAHDTRVQNAFTRASFENLHATYQIIKALLEHEDNLIIDREHMLVVSPDEGAIDRCLYYAYNLGLDLDFFYKRRDTTRVIDGKNPIIKHEIVAGHSIKGKDILIVDDMIGSGESVLHVATELKNRECGRVFIAVAFALFTEGLQKYHEAYDRNIINRVYASNLSYRPPELKDADWFVDVDVTEFIAYLIDCMNRNQSISALLDNSKKISDLLQAYRA